MPKTAVLLALSLFAAGCAFSALATEFHVAPAGDNAADGSAAHPLKTIMAAAQKAQPGDTVTVHAGTYRERVDPPRGGTDDAHRIVYQAAKGEKVVITGSDRFTAWGKVSGETWKLVIPNKYFGPFNPYAEKVSGDWFNGLGRTHRRGMVYLSGEWLPAAANLDAVTGAGGAPAWFSVVDGVVEEAPGFLMNVASIKPGAGAPVAAAKSGERSGPQNAANAEGGECVGYITHGAWLKLGSVDFGAGAETLTVRAAAHPGTGGVIEIRDGQSDGVLLGTVEIAPTGGWQKWQNFDAKIKRTAGKHDLFLVFKSAASAKAAAAAGANTTIYARLPAGTDPNAGAVEVGVRDTVFTPSKTGVNFITVSGFDLRNAATNWAAPTAGQRGVVTAYWNKGWIIEDNEISYSRCCGVVLAKNSDAWDGKRGTTEGYYDTIRDAFEKDGWSRENIGSHIVRRNRIHHCGQTGIVGSLGCAFSQIVGNDVHDCNTQGIWAGAEMAGIKFHAAIDLTIADNHIHHNGPNAGLWIDWMAQGTRITGNLFHDNQFNDIFLEVNHGPILLANNILLSPQAYSANSEGVACAHNLIAGGLAAFDGGRPTPYLQPHGTGPAGMSSCLVGDARWHNNILASGANLGTYNGAGKDRECLMAGNVFAKGAKPSRFDKDAVDAPDFDTGAKLVKKDDGWYLALRTAPAWKTAARRPLVATALLGKAPIPQQEFTNPDGSPMAVDTDYFGKPRDKDNPFPGPFETPASGEIKVWPK